MANYRAIAYAAARAYGIDPNIFLRQINQESGFNPRAESSAGAEGIAQFMPSTARGMGINPMDPKQALFAAAKMDAGNLRKYGSYAQMLSAYNSGKANAYLDPSFAGGQTTRYVQAILGNKGLPNGGTGIGPVTEPPTSGGGGGLGPLRSTPTTQQQLAMALLQQSGQTVMGNGMDSSSLLGMALMRGAMGSQPQFPTQQTGTPVITSNGLALKGAKAGGFLPANAPYKTGRNDQGHDFQTAPGAPIIAPGNGVVTRVASDPGGFGPAYPIVHFTSGPYAGKSIYIGHTISQLKPGQRFSAGQVISRTGTHPIGNAGVPGWAEIGFAQDTVPGPFGQAVPFS